MSIESSVGLFYDLGPFTFLADFLQINIYQNLHITKTNEDIESTSATFKVVEAKVPLKFD